MNARKPTVKEALLEAGKFLGAIILVIGTIFILPWIISVLTGINYPGALIFVILSFMVLFVVVYISYVLQWIVIRPRAMKNLAENHNLSYKRNDGSRKNVVEGNLGNIPVIIYDKTGYAPVGYGRIHSRATVVVIDNKSETYRSFLWGYSSIGKLEETLNRIKQNRF